jgi:hypothetical protein
MFIYMYIYIYIYICIYMYVELAEADDVHHMMCRMIE